MPRVTVVCVTNLLTAYKVYTKIQHTNLFYTHLQTLYERSDLILFTCMTPDSLFNNIVMLKVLPRGTCSAYCVHINPTILYVLGWTCVYAHTFIMWMASYWSLRSTSSNCLCRCQGLQMAQWVWTHDIGVSG